MFYMLPQVIPVRLTVIQGITVLVLSQTATVLSCFSLMVSVCLETSCGLYICSVIYIYQKTRGLDHLASPLFSCV